MLITRVSWQEESEKILLLASLVALLIALLLIQKHHFRSGLAMASVFDSITTVRWLRPWYRRWRERRPRLRHASERAS